MTSNIFRRSDLLEHASKSERARAFLQNAMNTLFAFATPGFQERVWIRGDHPSRYVNDYSESAEMLQDFIPWLLEDDEWKHVPLSPEQAASMAQFYERFLKFDDSLTDRNSVAVLRDPRWPSLVTSAKDTMKMLEQGTHNVRPQFSDADFGNDLLP